MANKKWTIRKIATRIWVTAGIVFILWLCYSYQSHGVDESFLQNSNEVKVESTDDFYLFTPTKGYKNVFIFYPGAMVDPKAYVPLCRKIAQNDIKVYLIKCHGGLHQKDIINPKH